MKIRAFHPEMRGFELKFIWIFDLRALGKTGIAKILPPIRKLIYITNAIQSINPQLRKIIQSQVHFPTDDAASKLIWLALRNITAEQGRAVKDWKEAMNQFAIQYQDGFTKRAV